MAVRFGVGLGSATAPAEFVAAIDLMESAGIDSVWISEQVYSAGVDPFIGMAYALARTSRLKVGSSVAVLPGRHPVLIAKQLLTLTGFGPGRVLPAFGLRPARAAETTLFPAPSGRRAALFDESLVLLRQALSGRPVTFDGEFFAVSEAQVGPVPARPLDIWLGGSAPEGLRRVGRYADGWLGSFLTPIQAGRAVAAIKGAATEAGRTIEADHFGLSLAIAEGGIPESVAASIQRRNPGADPSELIATSWPDLHRLVDGYLEAGLTKFVVRTVGPEPLSGYLERFARELLPRQGD